MYKSLLVPIDGSGNANKALEVAAQLARPDDAELYLLHIPERKVATDRLGKGAGANDWNDNFEARKKAGQAIIDNAIDVTHVEDVTRHVLILDGKPAEVIEREAIRLDVDAIVLGNRGLGRIDEMRGGSVSREINHRAACRVITVR